MSFGYAMMVVVLIGSAGDASRAGEVCELSDAIAMRPRPANRGAKTVWQRGTTVEVVEPGKTWSLVSVGEEQGYVKSRWLGRVCVATARPAEPEPRARVAVATAPTALSPVVDPGPGPTTTSFDPQVPLLFEASFAHEASGQLDRALNDVLKILRIDTGHYVANLRVGWLYYLKGRHADSIDFYQKAMAIEPAAIEPRLGVLLPLMAAKDWPAAEEIGEQLLERAPGDYTAGSRLAFIYFSQGKYRAAQRQYQDVLRAHPSQIDAMLGLAWTFHRQGQSARAREMFNRVLSIRPKNLSARSGLDAL